MFRVFAHRALCSIISYFLGMLPSDSYAHSAEMFLRIAAAPVISVGIICQNRKGIYHLNAGPGFKSYEKVYEKGVSEKRGQISF